MRSQDLDPIIEITKSFETSSYRGTYFARSYRYLNPHVEQN